jgi:hypothetical protein
MDYLLGFSLGFLTCVYAISESEFDAESDKRIEPELKITIEDGKSDTVFIYKKIRL